MPTLYRPSAIEQYIARLPNHLQAIALQAVLTELYRWKSGNLTTQELALVNMAHQCGVVAAKRFDDIAIAILTRPKDGVGHA